MNIADLLTEAMHNDGYAIEQPAGFIESIRARRRRRRVTRIACSVVVIVVGVAAAATALPWHGSGTADTREPAATLADGTIAGSHPAYRIRNAGDWFFTSAAESDSFRRGYVDPFVDRSDVVPSPAPLGPLSQRLQDELEHAGLPADAALNRVDSDGGHRGDTLVTITLPSQGEVSVTRTTWRMPSTYRNVGCRDCLTDVPVIGVPGTEYAAVVIGPHPHLGVEGSSVQIVALDGTATTWISQTVSTDSLQTWAFTAAQWAQTHPQ